MAILPSALIAWSATIDTGVESVLLATYWASARNMSLSWDGLFDVAGQLSTSPTWLICRTCNSLVPRCTPWSMRNWNRLAIGSPSSVTQPVSITPALASTRASGIWDTDRNARTCGQSWPGALFTSAQLSSPRVWIFTCSSSLPVSSGAGWGTSNLPASRILSVTGGMGYISPRAAPLSPSGTRKAATSRDFL